MPSDLAHLSTLIGSNYPCLELICMVPKVFELLKFECTYKRLNLIHDVREASSAAVKRCKWIVKI